MSVTLSFFGAAGCVTGACFLLEAGRARVLIDCGMFQGSKTLKALNYRDFPFDPGKVDCVLLTHAHVDHSGLLPRLALAGFEGPVFSTVETEELCRVLLPDAGAIQEMEVAALNRRRERNDEPPVEPIYTVEDARESLRLFRTVPFRAWKEVTPGVKARFWPAGHILGAASIEVEIAEADGPLRLLFSGDIGPGGRDTTDDPDGPVGVDHVIVESTYGDVERKHIGQEERRAILAKEVRDAHASGGPLLIPAFAVERTQELIVDLLDLIDANQAPPAPIFLDSPLAIRACDVFLRHGKTKNGDRPFDRLRESRLLQFTESVGESRNLERMRGWHIIIAASGMCDAGRVRHHLKRLLWRPEATVLIVGYQAVGTLGRFLSDGARRVRIQGDEVAVRARVREIDVYSGHADAAGLLSWVQARKPIGGKVFLIHGEPPNLKGFAKRLELEGFARDTVVVAELDRTYRLRKAEAESIAQEPRIAPGAAAALDWHNRRSEVLMLLNEQLRAAASDADREALLQRVAKVLKP
jgi:metallo-beta-lactamase family protein